MGARRTDVGEAASGPCCATTAAHTATGQTLHARPYAQHKLLSSCTGSCTRAPSAGETPCCCCCCWWWWWWWWRWCLWSSLDPSLDDSAPKPAPSSLMFVSCICAPEGEMPQEGAGLEHARRQMQAVTVLVQLGVLPFDQALSALSPSTAALTSCSRLARTTHHAPRPTPHAPQPTPHTPHPTPHGMRLGRGERTFSARAARAR